MTIKKKLYISAGSIICAVLLIIPAVMVTLDRSAVADEKREVALEIQRGMASLDLMSHEYGLYQNPKMESQWYALYDRLRVKIDDTRYLFLSEIRLNYETLGPIFEGLVESVRRESKPQDNRFEGVAANRLLTQLLIRSKKISMQTNELSSEAYLSILSARQFGAKTIGGLAITSTLFITLILFFMTKNISGSIQALLRGIEASHDDLDYRIDLKSKDELSLVAEAFNQRLSQIKRSMSTEESLGKIIDDCLNEILIFEDSEVLRFLRVNRGAQENIGYTMEELSSMSPFDFTTAGDGGYFKEAIEMLRADQTQLGTFSCVYRRKNGSFYDVEVHLQMTTYQSSPAFIAIVMDISERVEAEKELARYVSELMLAKEDAESANISKSEFLSNMSHELRTPLNSMLILSEDLAENDEGNLNDEQVDSAKIIFEGGKDLLKLINGILDLAKVESGALVLDSEELEVRPFFDGIDARFSLLAKEQRLHFDIWICEDLPTKIWADQHKVEQILDNLIDNAFKFTEEGEIRLNVSRPERGVVFSKKHLQYDNTIAFSVSDTGIGIAPEQQNLIFESFEQGDGSISRKYGGTGLGLTISREFAELSGGEIQMSTVLGEGSTFTLYLPERYAQSDEGFLAA